MVDNFEWDQFQEWYKGTILIWLDQQAAFIWAYPRVLQITSLFYFLYRAWFPMIYHISVFTCLWDWQSRTSWCTSPCPNHSHSKTMKWNGIRKLDCIVALIQKGENLSARSLGLENAETHSGLYLSWGGSDAGTVASDCGFAYWLLPIVSPSALDCEMNNLSIVVCLPVQARWNSLSVLCMAPTELCMQCSYL